MRALGSIFLALVGCVVGYLGAALIYYLVMTSLQGGDFEGGHALGAALVIGPIGALIGGVAGLFFGLGKFRSISAEKKIGTENLEIDIRGEAGDTGYKTPSENSVPDQTVVKREAFLDRQGIIAILVLGLILFGIWFVLFRDDTPPSFPQFGPRPIAHFEIKVPTESIVESDGFGVRMELHSVNNIVHVYDPIKRRVEENNTVFSGSIKLLNKTQDRSIAVWLSMDVVYYFDLGLEKNPIERTEFSDWRRVSRIEYRKIGITEFLPADAQFFIRSRASWGQKQN